MSYNTRPHLEQVEVLLAAGKDDGSTLNPVFPAVSVPIPDAFFSKFIALEVKLDNLASLAL